MKLSEISYYRLGSVMAYDLSQEELMQLEEYIEMVVVEANAEHDPEGECRYFDEEAEQHKRNEIMRNLVGMLGGGSVTLTHTQKLLLGKVKFLFCVAGSSNEGESVSFVLVDGTNVEWLMACLREGELDLGSGKIQILEQIQSAGLDLEVIEDLAAKYRFKRSGVSVIYNLKQDI